LESCSWWIGWSNWTRKAGGAVYVVYFNIETREVLFTQRKVSNAVGFGFRNYWFRVVKDAEPVLSKYR